MESLGEKQRRFCGLAAKLINYAESLGYQVAFGEAGRSDEQAEINALGASGRARVAALLRADFPFLATAIENNGNNNGIRLSGHRNFLAVDLKLYRDGAYLTRSEDYAALGAWWKQQAPDCRWGGDFPGDGNHFSIEHNGVK